MLIRWFQFGSLSHVHKLMAIFRAHHSQSVCFFCWTRCSSIESVQIVCAMFVLISMFSFTLFAILIATRANIEKKKKERGRKDVGESRVQAMSCLYFKANPSLPTTIKNSWNNRIANWAQSFWRFRTKNLLTLWRRTETVSFTKNPFVMANEQYVPNRIRQTKIGQNQKESKKKLADRNANDWTELCYYLAGRWLLALLQS